MGTQPSGTSIAVYAALGVITIFVFVLLGAGRLRMLVAAVFVCSLIVVADMVVVFFMAHIIHPIINTPTMSYAFIKFPHLHYAGCFLTSIIVAGCCLLAAFWIRNIQTKPPLKIHLLFCMLISLFAVISSVWYYDLISNEEVIVKHMSFLAFGFMGTLLLGVLLILFYIYTRLVIKTSQVTENQGDYAQFIQHLSKRELELIDVILAGNKRYKEIADKLNISVNTVKFHLKHIYRVTGVSNISALLYLFRNNSGSCR